MNRIAALIKKRELQEHVLKWGGAFRYLNSANDKGFLKEEWQALNQPIDKGLTNTLFRLLQEENFLVEPLPGYFKISNELAFQRTFELIHEVVNFDFSILDSKPANLLWTLSSQISSSLPNHITEHFGYLYTYFINEIAAVEQRIIFLAPYFTKAGFNQLLVTLNAICSIKNNLVVDFIVSDINSTMNQSAFDYLYNRIELNPSNNIRIFEPSDKQANSLWFHAKLLLIDGKQGYLGSANFSERALNSQFELGVMLDKGQVKPINDLIDYWIKSETFTLIKSF